MPSPNDSDRPPGGLNPLSLRLEELARILTASGPKPVTVAMLRDDLDDGAPTNPDGTVNLVHYVAWLVKEMAVGQ
jgi:hypothetical protein